MRTPSLSANAPLFHAASLLVLLIVTAMGVHAQHPDTLRHSIPPPPSPPGPYQTGTRFAETLAADGGLIVVGAPYEDVDGRQDAGAVKIFDAATGILLHDLKNPAPKTVGSMYFGQAIAVSGTRVVVGSGWNDPGANFSGRAYMYDLSSPTPTVPAMVVNNPSPAASANFGHKVAISGNWMAVRTKANSGRIYIYNLTQSAPDVPVMTFNNPIPSALSYGLSISMAGTRLAISGTVDDPNLGRVFVHDLEGVTPYTPILTLIGAGENATISETHVASRMPSPVDAYFQYGPSKVVVTGFSTSTNLTNPTPPPSQNADTFGFCLATSGSRVAVGYSVSGNLRVVHVYDVSSATPNTPIASVSGPSNLTNFGESLAFSGDRLVVGARGVGDLSTGVSGVAYVYDLATPAQPVMTLSSPVPAASTSHFGYSVSVSGTSLLVGAFTDSTGAPSAGSAHLYDLAGPTPTTPLVTLRNPTPNANDFFGGSTAISGRRAVVGASSDDTDGTDTGIAYVYDFARAIPNEPWLLLRNPTGQPDLFGTTVAMSENFVVVGAPRDRTIAQSAGAAYVYDLSGGTPTTPVLVLYPPSSSDFGSAVAISGTRVVVGASWDDTGATNAGTVYVYDLSSPTPTVPVRTINNPTPANDDQFGRSVAISGTRVVVGTLRDENATYNGSAYVYDLAGPAPTVPILSLNSFGGNVSVSGNRVVVGSFVDVTVFDLASATPGVPVAKLLNPTPAADDAFGAAVAIDGTTLAVGASGDDTLGFRRGFAYVYTPSNPGSIADLDGDGLLDSWEIDNFGSTAGHSALDDFDKDGASELLELAFNRDPKVPDANVNGVPTIEGGFLTMTIAKRPGVAYAVESGDSPNAASLSAVNTTVLVSDGTTLKVRDNVPIGAQPTRIMRVKVTGAP